MFLRSGCQLGRGKCYNSSMRNLIVGFSLFLFLSLALILYERNGQPNWAHQYVADKGPVAGVLGESITEDALTVRYRYDIRKLADVADLTALQKAVLGLSVPPVYQPLHLRLAAFLGGTREPKQWDYLRRDYTWLPARFGPNL